MDHQREQSSQGFIPIQKCVKWTINHQLLGELGLPLWRGIKGEGITKSLKQLESFFDHCLSRPLSGAKEKKR